MFPRNNKKAWISDSIYKYCQKKLRYLIPKKITSVQFDRSKVLIKHIFCTTEPGNVHIIRDSQYYFWDLRLTAKNWYELIDISHRYK